MTTAYDYESLGGPASPAPFEISAFLRALRIDAARWLAMPRSIAVATPLAGAEWSVTVPSGVAWIPVTVTCRLVTDATAQTRVPSLVLSDGTTDLGRLPSAGTQGASLSNRHGWARGFNAGQQTNNAVEFCSGLPFAPLAPNFILKSSTTQLQAVDQWSLIGLYVIQLRERTWQELARYAGEIDSGAHDELFPGFPLGL